MFDDIPDTLLEQARMLENTLLAACEGDRANNRLYIHINGEKYVPARSLDPIANRRSHLVARLEEQKTLLQDASYVRKVQRWVGKGDERRQVEKHQRVRPWWRSDASGRLVMCVYHGSRPMEFEKGKSGIAIASRDKLPGLVEALIAAAQAGELDELMARASKPVPSPKSRKAA
jgi:hypothetical protein